MSGNKSMGKCTFLRCIILTIVLHTKGETIQGNFFILKKLVEAPSKDWMLVLGGQFTKYTKLVNNLK